MYPLYIAWLIRTCYVIFLKKPNLCFNKISNKNYPADINPLKWYSLLHYRSRPAPLYFPLYKSFWLACWIQISWQSYFWDYFKAHYKRSYRFAVWLTFDPIFLSMSSTRTFCWMYISSGDLPGASSRFIPPAPEAPLNHHTINRKIVFSY